jgi:hypothetical protein
MVAVAIVPDASLHRVADQCRTVRDRRTIEIVPPM